MKFSKKLHEEITYVKILINAGADIQAKRKNVENTRDDTYHSLYKNGEQEKLFQVWNKFNLGG